MHPRSRTVRPGRIVWGILVVALLVLAGFWAGRVTMQPPAVATDLPDAEVLVDVTEQTLGRELNLNVTVSQPRRVLAANALTGVVTSVSDTGEVAVGDELYRVAGVPVRAVQGATPFHRALGLRDRGEDVRQLQQALVALGLLSAADGTYGASTERAVKTWQKQLGIAQSGRVALGELVAVPHLPSALSLDADVIGPGVVLAGGEKVVHGNVGEPTFVLRLSQQQARLVPESATVTISYQGHEWQAVVAGTENDDVGDTLFHLRAPDGGPVCGVDCWSVSTGGEIFVRSRVQVVPPTSGPAVPVAAITTHPDGTASVLVVDAAGTRTARPVTVLGSQDGVAVVDGVAEGERVQVLAAGNAARGAGAVDPAPPASSPEPTPER